MREHEVPTHVQAEDKVLLGFTFPQVVAMTAVCALSYGAYRYAPAGPPSELVRSEPPAPAQPVKSGPGPLRLMARRAGKTLRRLRPKRKGRERTGGRMPFRPHRLVRQAQEDGG